MSLIYRKYQEGGKIEKPIRMFYPFKAMTGTALDQGDGYNSLMTSVVAEKGSDASTYESMMDKIAFHESKYLVEDTEGDKDYKYLDSTSKQEGGGPGRGLFMFESGKESGGITAVRRTRNYMARNKLVIPKWLEDANKLDSLDASTLDEKKQKMLFLGNYMEHPKANLGNVASGKQTITDFWSNYHQTQNDPEKIKNFNKDLELYKKRLAIPSNRKGGLIYNKVGKYQKGSGILPNFQKRIDKPDKFIENPDGSVSTHRMASFESDGKFYAAPTIVENSKGELVELEGREFFLHSMRNKNYKEFATEKEAQDYASGGYKKGTPMEGFGSYGKNNSGPQANKY